MAMQKFEMFICKRVEGYGEGSISLSEYDRSKGSFGHEWVLIETTVVEVDVPEIDTRQVQIDLLEERIKKERTESQGRINLLLERISKLRAITHED